MPATNRPSHQFGYDNSDQVLPTITVWKLQLPDLNGSHLPLDVDLVHGSAPFLIGLDYDRQATTLPAPSCSWTLGTHEFSWTLQRDTTGSLRRCLQILQTPDVALITHDVTSSTPLDPRRTSLATQLARDQPNLVARRLHAYTHFNYYQMKQLCKKASILTASLDSALKDVATKCITCPGTGNNVDPRGLTKVSMTKHLRNDCNLAVQMDHCDMITSYDPLQKSQQLVMVDEDSSYSECTTAINKTPLHAMGLFHHVWLMRYGAPAQLSGDPAFNCTDVHNFCARNNILWVSKPPRRHNTIGLVERRIGVVKSILERLVRANDNLTTREDPSILIRRANFCANSLVGTSLASSSEIFLNRQPNICDLPATEFSPDMRKAAEGVRVNRALSKLLRSKTPSAIPTFKAGDTVYAHAHRKHGSAKDAIGWCLHHVVETIGGLVHTRPITRTKGKVHRLSPFDIRPVPKHPITAQMFKASLDHECHAGKPCSSPTVANTSSPHYPHSANPLSVESTLFSKIGSPEKDVGILPPPTSNPTSLSPPGSDDQQLFQQALDVIGRDHVMRSKISNLLPTRIIDQALLKELTVFDTAVTPITSLADYPTTPTIGSHVLYRIKSNEAGTHSLKARIVLHGNEEHNSLNLRRDAAALSFTALRVILTIAALCRLEICSVDAASAYLQSGDAPRPIIVRPPRECLSSHRYYWLLKLLPYGIRDAGRQWLIVFENWLINEMGFEILPGLPQVFVKFRKGGGTRVSDDAAKKLSNIELIVGKLTDDLIIAGNDSNNALTDFLSATQKKWKLGKVLRGPEHKFNGTMITTTKQGVTLDMNKYVEERLKQISITSAPTTRASEVEKTQHRSMAGVLSFLGMGSTPQASYMSSIFLQQNNSLNGKQLRISNDMISKMQKINHTVLFPFLSETHNNSLNIGSLSLMGISDAAFRTNSDQIHGQGGCIIGINVTEKFSKENHFYYLASYSTKLKRVVYSSFGAEILAAAETENMLFGLKQDLEGLFGTLVSELLVDSHGLYETITTLHEAREYRMRQTVARIREAFDNGDLDVLRWIPGILNIGDALTKYNMRSWELLTKVLSEGKLPLEILLQPARGIGDDWKIKDCLPKLKQ